MRLGSDEIYAYGLRNPYRFSFDRGDGAANLDRGKLYLADAGWNDREEIDLIEKGKNYGWVIREGTENMAGTFPARPMKFRRIQLRSTPPRACPIR